MRTVRIRVPWRVVGIYLLAAACAVAAPLAFTMHRRAPVRPVAPSCSSSIELALVPAPPITRVAVGSAMAGRLSQG